MKLYTFERAPNPRRVHVYLREKGIDLPLQHVDILKRENRTPAFLKEHNPLGGLPVLELDDGTQIAESVAICRYLEALHPEPPLFGRDAREQGLVEMWIRRIELGFMVPLGLVWVHDNPLTKGVLAHPIREVADQNREVVSRYYAFLDQQLERRDFLATFDFTMADILALTTMDFAVGLNDLKPAEEHENVARWHALVSARPSVTPPA
jgi:glutathione S-transferase